MKAGWNAIYLFTDASYQDIQANLSSYPQIEEVWRWQPDGLTQRLLTSPQEPVAGSEWAVWRRNDLANSALNELRPNFAYLIKVQSGAADFTLNLKGEATLPRVIWRTDGVNLIGFPVSNDPKPQFGDFLDSSVLLASSNGIYDYIGGDLSTSNPAKILNPSPANIDRGNAYWINIGRFSRYYGPIRLEIMGGDGLEFSASNNSIQLLATNISSEAIEVEIDHLDSETPPSAQKNLSGKTPLLLRNFDSENGQFSFDAISETISETIQAGESKAWVFSINRADMTGEPGDLFASLLRVSGGSGTEIYLPTSAEVTSTSGLWIGEVLLDQVGSLLRTFERGEEGETNFDETGQPILVSDEVTPANATELPPTAQKFPLRVIVHVDESGQATLLSHAFIGQIENGDTPYEGISTVESLLDPRYLDSAVRLSSANLPLDTVVSLTGDNFIPSASLTSQIITPFDSATNPFVHSYHPDHDNLDARFQNALSSGQESYTFTRDIKMNIDADGLGSNDPSWGSTLLTGDYEETISGIHKNDIRVRGRAKLFRVSPIPTLETP